MAQPSFAATDLDALLDEVRGSADATADLFWRAARSCLDGRGHGPSVAPLVAAINGGAWMDASNELMVLVFPGSGFMAGRLPTGSAHARLMLAGRGFPLRPIDSFREDGNVALALLEVIVIGNSRQLAH